MEEEIKTKKKRLSLACNVCRRKKIKCDGVKPTCGKCQRFNQDCLYTTNIKKRGPRQGHIELLEQRLKKMEELLTVSNSEVVVDAPAPLRPKPQNRLGYTVLQSQQPLTQHQLVSSGDLPSFNVLEHLVDLFFQHCISVASILNVHEFKNSVKNKTCNSFLLYSVLSVAARFSNRPDIVETPLWMSGEKYASKARLMIDQVIENPGIEHLQGILILIMNEYGCARGRRCWTFTGFATRMAIEIGLHKEKIFEEAPNSILPLHRWHWYETRRKLYWESFIHDKFSSASTGRPAVLDPLDCEIMLPVDSNVLQVDSGNDFYQCSFDQTRLVHYHIIRNEVTKEITGIQMNPLEVTLAKYEIYLNQIGWESRIMQGVVILGKITQLVNRGYKNEGHYAPYECSLEFESLSLELDEWVTRLPRLEYRESSRIKSTQFVLAHIMYNTLIVLLNRPSLVMIDIPGLSQVTQVIKDKVHKSMKKCLAAVDNVTIILDDIYCKVEFISPFTAYLVYTTATVLVNSIFSMNINESQKAELALKEYFRFLSEMKVYWAMADKLYFMIRDLYAVHQKVLHTCQLNSPTKTTAITTTSPVSTRKLPLLDLSTSDSTMNQNWGNNNGGLFTFFNDNNNRSIFTSVSSFDLRIQQQQQQHQNHHQQQYP